MSRWSDAADLRERIPPSMRAILRQLPDWTFTPRTMALARAALRVVVPPAPLPKGMQRRRVPPGRLTSPTESAAPDVAVLWLHGGGRVMGDPRQDDRHALRLASALGAPVLSARYRLAPRHAFPAALDDVVAAWRWLTDPEGPVGASRVVVGGESAGGGLAAELCQRLHDEGGLQPVGQALIYPMLDDRTSAAPGPYPVRHPVWNHLSNHHAWNAWLAGAAGAPTLPPYAAAARREDLSGLPPA